MTAVLVIAGVKLHVILECVAAVEPLGAEVAGEGHLAAVDEVVLLEVMLHAEPLGADAAAEGARGILHGVEGVGEKRTGGDGGDEARTPIVSDQCLSSANTINIKPI